MDKTRVLLVDDNVRFRWGVMEALVSESSLEVVEEASDGNEAVEKAKALRPDVVLMDLYMPTCNGVEATRRLQAEMPEIKVLVFTISESEADLVNALKAGARGYLLKNEKTDQIVQAIQYVARGGILLSPTMATKLLKGVKKPRGVSPAAVKGVEAGPLAGAEAAIKPAVAEKEDTASAELPAAVLPAKPSGASQERKGQLGAVAAAARDEPVSEAALLVSPPVEPALVLKLHKWIKEVANGEVDKISSSWGGETVISTNFRNPIPLARMLAELPEVSEVVEEHYTEDAEKALSRLGGQSQEGSGAQRPQPKLFRLVLKAE